MYIQQRKRNHLLKPAATQAQSHGHKGIISPGRSHRIQFVFNALPSLIAVPSYLVPGINFRLFSDSLPGRIRIGKKFFPVLPVAFLGIRSQNLIHLRNSKATVLLSRCAENNISHHIKGGIQGLGFVVPYISHLKAAF